MDDTQKERGNDPTQKNEDGEGGTNTLVQLLFLQIEYIFW